MSKTTASRNAPEGKEKVRRLGRPTKRTVKVVDRFLHKLRWGYSLARSARWAGVHPKTVQRWLKTDRSFLDATVQALIEGSPRAEWVSWMKHPFRGMRPPRSKRDRRRRYPQPKF